MAILATRDWSKSQFGGGTASEEYLISGVDTAADAEALGNDDTGFHLPQANESHPRNASMCVEPSSRVATAEGFGIFRLPIRWSIPSGGGSEHPFDSNPLQQPATFLPGYEEVMEQADVDAFGNPIVNAAGDAFDGLPPRPFVYLTFTIRKNLASYDPFIAAKLMNTVNSREWVPKTPGLPKFAEGTLELKRWVLTDFVTEGPLNYYPCEFFFRMTTTQTQPPPGALPDPQFRLRLLNQGRSGWYFNAQRNRSEKGKFTIESPPNSGNYQELGQDIRLQKDGRPFDLTRGVYVENGQTPVANPTPLPDTIVELHNTFASWLQFARSFSSDFSALPI